MGAVERGRHLGTIPLAESSLRYLDFFFTHNHLATPQSFSTLNLTPPEGVTSLEE